MPALSPYETVKLYGKAAPSHVKAERDAARLAAYDTYEDLYNNQAEAFALVLKTEAGQEVYRRLIPSARTIVEATNRYLARGLSWSAEPEAPATGTEPAGEAVAAEALSATLGALDRLFIREEFSARFMSLKRWVLVRADGMLHVTADPSKPEGQRLRIVEITPSTYFAIEDPADSERVIGCYLVNIILDDAGDEIVARLEYRRIISEEMASTYGTPIGGIFMKLGFYTLDGWDDRATDEDIETVAAPSRFGDPRFATLLAGQALPPEITAIPVYHFRNRRRGGAIYGVSEIQGLETIINGINQTATDEDVSVALQGLGVYWASGGRPVDDEGNAVEWEISPASIIELEREGQMGRITGVASVQPMQDHIDFLKTEGREASGTPTIATGAVDSASVASGVALSLQMAPMVAKTEELEEEFSVKLDQLVFDLLNGWMPAYEGWQPNGVRVFATFEDPIPKNAKEIIENYARLVEAKIVSAAWARQQLTAELGYTFDPNEGGAIASEAEALVDATGARLAGDVESTDAGAEVGL